MNQYEARKAIAQRWIAMWPGLSGGVPYGIDVDSIVEDATYARLSIDFEDSEQRTLGSIGNRKFTRPGSLIVELYAPPDSGAKTLDQLAQHVVTMFEGARFGAVGTEDGIVCFASTRGRLASTVQHATLSIGVDFEFYEVR